LLFLDIVSFHFFNNCW